MAVLEVLWSLPDWVGIQSTSIAKKKSLVRDSGVCVNESVGRLNVALFVDPQNNTICLTSVNS